MNAPFAKNHMAHLLPAGLSYRGGVDDMVEQPIEARRRAGRRFARALADAVAYLAAMPRRRAVLDELSGLSDRELADIGVSRSDLKRVFEPAFARDVALRRSEYGFVDYKL